MKRRDFIAGLGSTAAWPFVARAQQAERMRRIGVLSNLPADAKPSASPSRRRCWPAMDSGANSHN
jgi:hypothetical protein